MPLVRVHLEATRPHSTVREVATFHVVVTDETYARGEHVNIAAHRAHIRGYAPPYACVSEEVTFSLARPIYRCSLPEESEALTGRVTMYVRCEAAPEPDADDAADIRGQAELEPVGRRERAPAPPPKPPSRPRRARR